ncbi:MAG: hypothetical protein Q8L86_12425 [Vicinamibacterales bacterium]|nr:hypothetical protein [Vicinamibacterales bacterium]
MDQPLDHYAPDELGMRPAEAIDEDRLPELDKDEEEFFEREAERLKKIHPRKK